MSTATHDDGFHEIQLNGKQLVFLFMAVTVVSVVIFLCGVLVGRGVRLERGGPAESLEAVNEPAPPPGEMVGNPSAPVAPDEKTSFSERLERSTPLPEKIQPSAAPPPAKTEPVGDAVPPPAESPSASTASTPAPAPESKPAPPAESTPAPDASRPSASLAEPAGPGMAVQVSAFRVRTEAEALATRLIGKGYSAYVVPPASGAPALFRVRVGKFKEQREADRVAARLKKEEQFDPWIVR